MSLNLQNNFPTWRSVLEHSPRLSARAQHLSRLLLATEGLWSLGDVAAAARAPCIAVIGTRTPSEYGLRFVREFVPLLKGLGCTLLSGGALGIDGEAHRVALEYGIPTQAWLVGPLRSPSPRTHYPLFEQMLQREGSGLWVPSALEPDVFQPPKHFWLERNRWLMAASDAVVVVEATRPSGTLTSVRAASELGVPAFALPGSVFSSVSRGCNWMIAESGCEMIQGMESLLLSLMDVLQSAARQHGPFGSGLVQKT